MEQTRNTLDSPRHVARQEPLVTRRETVAGRHVLRVMSRGQFESQLQASILQGAKSRLSKSRHAILATAFLLSRDWEDLNNRLEMIGFSLRDEGRTLSIFRLGAEVRECTAQQLGFPLDKLRRRFGCTPPAAMDAVKQERARA